jgi:hypothetical protein
VLERLHRRQESIDHCLVPGLRLAASLHALERLAPRLRPTRGVDLGLVAHGGPELEQQRAVERPRRAADLGHERHGRRLQDRAGALRLGGVELLQRGAHAAVHVGAVVAVADRGVEANELLAMLAHLIGEPAHPGQGAVTVDRHPP